MSEVDKTVEMSEVPPTVDPSPPAVIENSDVVTPTDVEPGRLISAASAPATPIEPASTPSPAAPAAPDSIEKGVSPPPTSNTDRSRKLSSENDVEPRRKLSDMPVVPPPIKETTPKEKAQKFVLELFDSMPVAIAMSIATLWALFASDMRDAFCGMTSDVWFTVSLSICFFLFVIELLAGCFSTPEYVNWTWDGKEKLQMKHIPGSFYFYLDIIATVSLGLEISWMNRALADDGTSAEDWLDENRYEKSRGFDEDSAFNAERLTSILRMVRIVRMVKFYKYYQINQKKQELKKKLRKRQQQSFRKKQDDIKVVEVEKVSESRVGEAMTNLTTQRVLALVFGLLIVIPLFMQVDDNQVAIFKLKMLQRLTDCNNQTIAENYFKDHDETTLAYIIKGEIYKGKDLKGNFDLGDFRPTEMFQAADSNDFASAKYFVFHNIQAKARTAAGETMGLTAFVTVLLMLATIVFSYDVRSLVITPIEKMVELVQRISVNPLGVDYDKMDEGDKDAFAEGMETTLLLQTIQKIGSLMRVGFGEAGANVIAKNLAESKGGKLNMMGAGTTIESIFGFCDVRQFTDTTECLQEEVMLFVNRIAHILHSIVVQCSGAANKNIGDAFLLTWKLEEEGVTKSRHNTALADQALIAFLKGLVELNRHQDFICNFSVAATARLYKRFPGYNVRIGCGLHVGWAIEGAIGTHRKIDASYLSPSVNMSEYLESSTKAYGVPILLSEPFYNLLSPQAVKYCRQVDRVLGPLEEPFGMFTYDSDLDYDFNAVVATTSALKAASVFKSKLAARKAKREEANNRRRSSVFGGGGGGAGRKSIVAGQAPPARRGSAFNDIEMQKIAEQQKKLQEERKNKAPEIKVNAYEKGVWERDADLIQLRHQVNDSYRITWSGAIRAYIAGDWTEAVRVCQEVLAMSKGGDGPAKFLLSVMDKYGNKAPSDWKGYRVD